MCVNFKPFNVKAADCMSGGLQQLIAKLLNIKMAFFLLKMIHFLMNMVNFGRNRLFFDRNEKFRSKWPIFINMKNFGRN